MGLGWIADIAEGGAVVRRAFAVSIGQPEHTHVRICCWTILPLLLEAWASHDFRNRRGWLDGFLACFNKWQREDSLLVRVYLK